MLPLSTDCLLVELGAAEVTVTRVRKGWRAAAAAPVRINGNNSLGWESQLETLGRWFDDEKCLASSVEFVLLDHFVHYACLPWSDSVTAAAERVMYAQACFESLYGTSSKDWTIHVDQGEYGKAALACAIDRGLIPAVRAFCLTRRLRLQSLRPGLMDVFNRHRRLLREDAILVTIEQTRCVIACISGSEWQSVRSTSYADDNAGLSILISRERVLQGLGANTNAFVDARNEEAARAISELENFTVLPLIQHNKAGAQPKEAT